jgi:toxin ParE1/3/4
MTVEVIWSPQARRDLLDIYVIIALDNPAAAERLYTAIETKANALQDFPRLGRRRPEIRPTVRMLVEGPYLILFETRPDTDEGPVDQVEIVRVVDGRRDLTNLF